MPITSQPRSVTASVGGTAQFHVTAPGASGYQWEILSGGTWYPLGGANVSGAATSTLVISGLRLVDSGSYRCETITAGVASFSDAATLTVAQDAGGPQIPTGLHPIGVGSGGGTGVVTSGGSLLSGIELKSYSTGTPSPSSALPYANGPIVSQLIPQAGGTMAKGSYNEDVWNLPFRVLRAPGWRKLIPKRGTSLSDYSTMYVWDPQYNISLSAMFADFSLSLRGLQDDVIPDTIIKDDVSLETVTIQTDSGGTLTIAFYAPRTTYRYIVRGNPNGQPKYRAVTNADERPIEIFRWIASNGERNSDITDTSNNNDADVASVNTGSDFYQPLFPQLEQINVSTTSEQMGAYYLCEDVAIKTLVSPYSV